MSKYIITHACGHQKEYQFYGPYKERDRKAAYLETCDCPACQDAKLLAETDETAFAQLEGSEKQIAWARVIRAKAVKDKDSAGVLAKFSQIPTDQQDRLKQGYLSGKLEEEEGCAGFVTKAIAAICETKASWWIDHRF